MQFLDKTFAETKNYASLLSSIHFMNTFRIHEELSFIELEISLTFFLLLHENSEC